MPVGIPQTKNIFFGLYSSHKNIIYSILKTNSQMKFILFALIIFSSSSVSAQFLKNTTADVSALPTFGKELKNNRAQIAIELRASKSFNLTNSIAFVAGIGAQSSNLSYNKRLNNIDGNITKTDGSTNISRTNFYTSLGIGYHSDKEEVTLALLPSYQNVFADTKDARNKATLHNKSFALLSEIIFVKPIKKFVGLSSILGVQYALVNNSVLLNSFGNPVQFKLGLRFNF